MNLCFDCDDTLYDLQWPFKQAVMDRMPECAIDLSVFYQRYRDIGDTIFELEHQHIITNDDVGIYRIYKACESLDIPCTLEQAADFQDAYRENQKHIGMDPILHQFFSSCTCRIAILTNGQESHQKDKVCALGMYEYVPQNLVFSSEGIGYAKPDPRAFETVVAYTHTKPGDWIYIGDNYINDMEGAKQAGWHTIHFNRHRRQEGPCSDYVVYNETQLVALLAKIEADRWI